MNLSSKDDGGPAFAREHSECSQSRTSPCVPSQVGMSLRDYFAAQVISQCHITVTRQEPAEADPAWVEAYAYRFAKTAYAIADAMLEQRKK